MEEVNENMRDERNVMVLFLSHFKLTKINDNKQSASGEKVPCEYMLQKPEKYTIIRGKDGDGDKIKSECIQTNEAPIKDVLFNLNGKPLDAIFYLTSKNVSGVKRDESNKEVPKEPISILNSVEDTEPQIYANEIEIFLDKRLPSINEDESLKGILKKPLSKDMFYGVAFNEFDSDTSKECIEATLALEQKIREYMENEIGSAGRRLSMKNCNLYVDITGGMRTANMAISAAAQLLQYDGAHLQRMVYSDWDFKKVFDIQPINDLYKLVAGVYAFTNYGRSEALNEYFGDETYGPLHSLRKTMDEFSDAVQLCQEGLFEIKLRHLIEQLENFPDENESYVNSSAKVKLFRRMIPNMLSEYSSLVSKDERGNYLRDKQGHMETDRIEIIRWCVKNKLLQQAVTFCTEWLPEYLIDHGVVYIDDLDLQRCIIDYQDKIKARNDTAKRVFLMKYITSIELGRRYKVPYTKGQDQMTTASKAIKILLNRKVVKTNLTDADTKDANYYIKEYTYIRAKLRNKVNHADSAGDTSDEDIKVDELTKRLMGYLDNLALLKDKPKPNFTGLWAKN